MKKIIAVALAALLVLATAACLAEDTIKIGFIGPLTGGAAVYGVSCLQGAQIAVNEINALGGLQIELNPQDDEHDAEKSVNAYNTLWDWGAQMIVGCVTTDPCKAVASVANEERMFMLTPSASSVDVIAGKDNIYRVCFNDPAQGAASALYISEHNLATKIAVIYNNADSYSTGVYQSFATEAAQLGMEIVSVTAFNNDTTDFSVQLTDAKEKGADLVFLPIYYNPASMILNQAKAMEYEPKFFGVDGMDGILAMEGFDTSLAEGVMLLTPFAADEDNEHTQKFVAEYQEAYNETPTQFSADGYDAVYALYEACQKAGITGETSTEDACEMLIEAMPTITVSGLTGDMAWTADGEVNKTPKAVTIENGAYVSK